MIASLFHLTKPHELSVKIKKYIRLSPTLWPLFIGQADALDLSEGLEPVDELEARSDFESFNTYYDESQQVTITLMNWCRQSIKVKMTPYERSLADDNWVMKGKIQPLPYPSWLTPPRTYKPNLDNPEESTPPTLKVESLQEHPRKISKIEEEPQLEIKGVTLPLSPVLPPKKKEIDKGTFPEDVMLEVSSSDKETKRSSDDEEMVNPLSSKGEIEEVSHVFARGNRLFHSQRKSEPQTKNLELLSTKQRKTLEKIFDDERFSSVSNGQFFALWRAINGTKSVMHAKSGSHIKLLNFEGKTVAGTFSHGDGMHYTSHTISYIRDALALIFLGSGINLRL